MLSTMSYVHLSSLRLSTFSIQHPTAGSVGGVVRADLSLQLPRVLPNTLSPPPLGWNAGGDDIFTPDIVSVASAARVGRYDPEAPVEGLYQNGPGRGRAELADFALCALCADYMEAVTRGSCSYFQTSHINSLGINQYTELYVLISNRRC